MAARFLTAGLIVVLYLVCLPLAEAQQFPMAQPSASQSFAPLPTARQSPLEQPAPASYDTAIGPIPYQDDGAYAQVSEPGTPSPFSVVKTFFHNMAIGAKRNNCWFKPFVYADRAAVRTHFVGMVNNGWRRQNTLGEYHFKPEGNTLTEAGELKVRWILLEGPAHHRTIYVHAAREVEDTVGRIDSVQQLAIRTLPGGPLPAVLQTHIPPPGWPASQVDTIGRKYQSSTPDPRLPAGSEETGDVNQ